MIWYRQASRVVFQNKPHDVGYAAVNSTRMILVSVFFCDLHFSLLALHSLQPKSDQSVGLTVSLMMRHSNRKVEGEEGWRGGGGNEAELK